MANRDRFVGFAFAAAHLLLETDNAGVITFAAGARCGLVPGALSDLVGRSLFEFCPLEEHSLLRILFQRLIQKGKLDLTHIVLRSLDGNKFSAFFGACRLPNHPDRCFLSVSIRGQAVGRLSGHRVPDLEAFLPVLESRLNTASATEISQALSMILIEGLPDTKNNQKLRELVEAYFLSISTDGDSAVRLADDYYAVLHSDEGALEDIQRDINQLLSDNSGGDPVPSTQMWRVNIGKTELQIADVARAVAFTLKKFASDNPRTIKITNIDTAVEDLLQSTVSRVSEVRRTLEKKNFRLVFQPIVRLTSGQIHHVEALMRVGDSASPAEFVAFAEGIGLNSDLDLMVLQSVLDLLLSAQNRKINVPDVAVNISAASLSSRLFLEQLEQILRPYGEMPRKLLIDITDISDVNDLSLLKAGLVRLRKMGIRRCLDDVGGGTSSFMSLNELHVDFAKLDGDLVGHAMKDVKGRTILQSIIQICGHLGTMVIAEKVESDDQRIFLRNVGVPLGQGYLLGRPAPDLPILDPPAKPRS
ncbi:MAG: EAL domain-containing protein [Rhodospirillaceae bacterium]